MSWRILKQKSFSSRKSSADAAEENAVTTEMGAAEENAVTTEMDAAEENAVTTEMGATAKEATAIETDAAAEEVAVIGADVTAEEATTIRTDVAEEKAAVTETGAAAEDMTVGSRAGTAVTRHFASKPRSESQYQLAAMLLKPSARVTVVGIHGFYSIPEGGGVIHVCQMTQLMDDDVIQNLRRR